MRPLDKKTKTRVVVADDHRLILEALRAVFAGEQDIELVAALHRATQLLPTVAREQPDVVVVDVRMPEIDGWSCLELIRRRHPGIAVLILTALPEDEIAHGLELGAAGVLGKCIDLRELVEAVRAAARGEVVGIVGFSPREPEPDLGLSPRELSILRALARGRSNRQIARELFIAEQTVKFHLTNIYAKLDVPNRTGAARLAYEKGLGGNPLAPV